MPGQGEIHYNADNDVELLGLKDPRTDTYENGATVSAELYNESVEPEAQIGGTITMDYVSGSDGDYRGEIADTLSIPWQALIRVEITAERLGRKGFWTVYAPCVKAPA